MESWLCIRDRIETTNNYLFECNSFNEFRQKIMQEICELILVSLLYGDRELSGESNKHIFIRIVYRNIL